MIEWRCIVFFCWNGRKKVLFQTRQQTNAFAGKKKLALKRFKKFVKRLAHKLSTDVT